MKNLILILLTLSAVSLHAQTDSTYINSILEHREELNAEFADKKTSPLTNEDRKHFEGLSFFPPDEKYRITAQFIRTDSTQPFEMKTTTDRKPIYQKYGEAHFEIDGIKYILEIYQSHRLKMMEELKNYLFLPFNDLTNGQETYAGGRFIDLTIPEGDTIIIDFNKAYNPYCTYNHKYSCPIPPAENFLKTHIYAGVLQFDGKHEH